MPVFVLITSHAPSLLGFRAPLIRELCFSGIKVFCIAPNFSDEIREGLVKIGGIPVDCPMERAGMNPVRDVVNAFRLWKILRCIKPDCVLSYFIKPVIYGSLAACLAGVPRRFAMVEGLGFVFTPTQDATSFKRRLLKRLVLWLYRVGMACVHRVIFLNPDDKDELARYGALPMRKAFLLGGIGVDLKKWPAMPPVLEPPTFLMVARLLREKGVDEYVAAARLVKHQYSEARFLLLGGLDENPGSITEESVRLWVDEGVIEWPGHVDVQPWMRQASIFVLPSYYREGVPASTQEAMAAGRAIITTDAPGCRETVVDGDNGFLVPVQDVDALARAMMKFLVQPELIERMGCRSREIAEEKYDVHKVNDVILRVMGIR